MKLHKYTQEEFDQFEVVDGFKNCPTGDYTALESFIERCRFDAGCRFGEGCRFCAECIFDAGCRFGEWCSIGTGCRFGERCRFGEWCSFGESCSAEFGEFKRILCFGGFGRYGRTTYVFLLSDGGVGIRCGCFAGDLAEFRKIVHKTHEGTSHEKEYMAIADLIELAMTDNK